MTRVELAPTDVAKIVTVNEARVGQGLGPLLLPEGTPDPDGGLSVSEFFEKKAAKAAAQAAPAGAPT